MIPTHYPKFYPPYCRQCSSAWGHRYYGSIRLLVLHDCGISPTVYLSFRTHIRVLYNHPGRTVRDLPRLSSLPLYSHPDSKHNICLARYDFPIIGQGRLTYTAESSSLMFRAGYSLQDTLALSSRSHAVLSFLPATSRRGRD